MGGKPSSMLTVDPQNFIAGAEVRAGPDWPADEAFGPTPAYTVSLGSAPGTVVVKFSSGRTKEVRAGGAANGGKYDLEYTARGVPLTQHNFRAGAIVARGPDWSASYNDQDGGGSGRAVALDGDWAKVRWVGPDGRERGSNTYRCGADGKHDLLIFPELTQQQVPGAGIPAAAATTTAAASGSGGVPTPARDAVIPEGCPVFYEAVVLGAKVARGPDWPANDDSAGPGVIISLAGSNRVRVRWANGTVREYRAGSDHFDLIYAEQAAAPVAAAAAPLSASFAPNSSAATTAAVVPGEVVNKDNYRVGARVVRGPHWNWGTQDSSGPGTLGPMSSSPTGAWAAVTWADKVTKNSYRIGADNAFDLRYFVDGAAPGPAAVATNATPAANNTNTAAAALGVPPPNAVQSIGFRAMAKVRRGRDWKFADQDGGAGATGVLLSIDTDNWARVRWERTGSTNTYRAGVLEAGTVRYDLEYAPDTAGTTTSGGSALATGSYSAGAMDVVTRENARIGARVVAGPDWCWPQSQLASGPGTLVSLDAQAWARVKFPNGSTNSYRCGVTDSGSAKFDLRYATQAEIDGSAAATTMGGGAGAATLASLQKVTAANFLKNAVVRRNPADWTWPDTQDGGDGGQGRLLSVDDDQWARVQWDNGVSNSFRVGASGKHDLLFAHNPPRIHSSANGNSSNNNSNNMRMNPTPKPGPKVAAGPPFSPGLTVRPDTTAAVGDPGIGSVPVRVGDRVARANFKAGESVVPNMEPGAWKWGNQHGGVTGRLLSIDSSDWAKVDFGGRINSYRVGGRSGASDLLYGTVGGGSGASPAAPATITLTAPPATGAAPVGVPTDNTDEACVVCLSNVKDHVAVPCGHLCLCGPCAVELKAKKSTCPICRVEVQLYMKVYK
jgi:hypothetical protein